MEVMDKLEKSIKATISNDFDSRFKARESIVTSQMQNDEFFKEWYKETKNRNTVMGDESGPKLF